MHPLWPQVLWVARHGQSAGNVARDAAEAAVEPWINVEFRDIDTPLSELGVQQSLALGRWFGHMDTGGGSVVSIIHYDANEYMSEKRCALEAWQKLLSDIVVAAPARLTPAPAEFRESVTA